MEKKQEEQAKNDNFMDHDEQMILNLLSAIEEEPNTTQKDLATRLGVAVGAVNSYLKRVIYKGYVKTKSLQRRRLRYLLTPSGIKEKTRLTYEFLKYSYIYIREIRRKTRELLQPYARSNKKRIVFWGSGEVAELAYLAVRELGQELVGIGDDENIGQTCVDFTIQDMKWLEKECEADVLFVLKKMETDSNSFDSIQAIAKQRKMVLLSLN